MLIFRPLTRLFMRSKPKMTGLDVARGKARVSIKRVMEIEARLAGRVSDVRHIDPTFMPGKHAAFIASVENAIAKSMGRIPKGGYGLLVVSTPPKKNARWRRLIGGKASPTTSAQKRFRKTVLVRSPRNPDKVVLYNILVSGKGVVSLKKLLPTKKRHVFPGAILSAAMNGKKI